MRFRITVRGDGVELRGFFDAEEPEHLPEFAQNMAPVGLVLASPLDVGVEEIWDGQPSIEQSRDRLTAMLSECNANPAEFIDMVAHLHYMQAMVIRGERDQREKAELDLRERELHHFETEQTNARLEADNARLEANMTALLRINAERNEENTALQDKIDRIKVARSNHPECDVHDDDDPVTCGWKRAVQDIDKALNDAPNRVFPVSGIVSASSNAGEGVE